jgi:hypothetical protein
MARIRSIKPEFPQSETIGKLSRDARLLFVQLWTIVDDAGRARAASRMLASLLYPYDDDAPSLIEGWLGELEREDCIRRYEVNGSRYLEISKWLKHQKIDKPSGSKMPAFGEGSPVPREDSRKLAPDLGPRTRDLGEDLGEGSSEPNGSGAEAPQASPSDEIPFQPDPTVEERELFRRGKEVLGRTAGGVITNLLKAKGQNVALARADIERASQAQDPMEFVAGLIRGEKRPAASRFPVANAYEDLNFEAMKAERRRRDEQQHAAGGVQ